MKDISSFSKIFLATVPVDFRKHANGLSIIVKEVLDSQPFESKSLFVFVNKKNRQSACSFACCISGHLFPAAMVHDWDGIYGNWLPEILQEFGCKSLRTPPRSPWENPFIERFNLSIKTEILNRSLLIDNNHIHGLCVSYQAYYNSKRPHQGIGGVIPDCPDGGKVESPDIKNLKIEKSQVLNGLVTEFRLAA